MGRLADLCDTRLRPFVDARTEEERDSTLEALLRDSVQPIIRRVLARRNDVLTAFPANTADDIASTVLLRFLQRLDAMIVFEEDAIAEIDDYVATLTYHTIYDFLRRRFPQRTRLRNRLRYVLQHDARFAVWTVDDEMICGLIDSERGAPIADLTLLADRNLPAGALDQSHPANALVVILRHIRRPIAFDLLQRTVAQLWDVADRESDAALPFLQDAQHDPLTQFESREYLAAVWRELALLPQSQRAALILNLRDADGRNAAVHFILLGLTTFDGLAHSVGMTPELLESLWDQLPLSDLEIAKRLDLTRQQVINLRQAGRRRMSRRLREWNGHKPQDRASHDE